jgi:hypothetical protein
MQSLFGDFELSSHHGGNVLYLGATGRHRARAMLTLSLSTGLHSIIMSSHAHQHESGFPCQTLTLLISAANQSRIRHYASENHGKYDPAPFRNHSPVFDSYPRGMHRKLTSQGGLWRNRQARKFAQSAEKARASRRLDRFEFRDARALSCLDLARRLSLCSRVIDP